MSTVIAKNANTDNTYRYLTNVNGALYPTTDWLIDPDVSALTNIEQKYWKVSGSTVIEMSQAEKDAVDFEIRDSSEQPNNHGEFVFGNRGKTVNKWLRTNATFMPSHRMPHIFFDNGIITGLTFLNYRDSADCDIEIYKNGTLWYTWQIRSKRYVYKTKGLIDLTFAEGDQLSVLSRKAGTIDPSNILVNIQYRYKIHVKNESGAATL